MAAIRKFTFDNDFDRPAKPVAAKPEVVAEPPPPPPPSFSEAEMAEAVAAARKTALAEGIAQGRAEAAAETERKIAAGLNAIGNHLGAIDKHLHLGVFVVRDRLQGDARHEAADFLALLVPLALVDEAAGRPL